MVHQFLDGIWPIAPRIKVDYIKRPDLGCWSTSSWSHGIFWIHFNFLFYNNTFAWPTGETVSCMSKVLALTQLKRKFVESSLLPGPCHKKFTALTALLPLKRPCRHQPATFLLENVQGLTMRKKGQAKVGQPMPCFIHSHLSSCAVFVARLPSHRCWIFYVDWTAIRRGWCGEGNDGWAPHLTPSPHSAAKNARSISFGGKILPS